MAANSPSAGLGGSPGNHPDIRPGAIPAARLKAGADADEWTKNLSVYIVCPECKETPPNLEFPGSHETVCGSCGLVLADREIDMHSEWRTFSNDDQNNDDPSRVGEAASPLLENHLETGIASGGTGRARDIYRAQNKQSSEKSNRALLAAYKEIGALCEGFGIQKPVPDMAKLLFKIVDDAKAFKGKTQEVIIAGCIFIACRRCLVPRTFTEIFAVTKVSRRDIGRIYKSLDAFFKTQKIDAKPGLNGTIVEGQDPYVSTSSTKPSDLCNRFCNHLDLPFQVTAAAISLADRIASDGHLAGRSPLSVVAACIYMASHLLGQGRSPKEISVVARVSDSTIRGSYRQLYAIADKVVDPEWIKSGKANMKNLPTG